MKKTARFASTLFCVVSWVAVAQDTVAAERGFYVGGYGGQSSKEADRDFYELFNDDIQVITFFAPTQETTSFDDSDTAFGLVIGYRLTPHFAIEGGYAKLGQVAYKSRSSGNFPQDIGTEDIGIETEVTGYTFAALGMLPLSRNWELFARAGVLFADNKITIRVTAEGQQFLPPLGSFSAADSQGSTNLQAGLGISRRFLDVYDLRLEYQRAFDVGDGGTGGKGDLDVVLLGLIVTF
jgi:opacity protein-like surface antigen